MNQEEAIKLLKEFNKWRRGKGKKYSQPGLPLNPVEIGHAIDYAIEHLSYRIPPVEFINIVDAAQATLKRIEKYVVAVGKGKIEAMPEMPLPMAKDRYEALRQAIQAGRKVCRRIARKSGVSKK